MDTAQKILIGMPYEFTSRFAPELQPYKFGGKELDEMHGLNWYDQGARPFDAIIPRTPTMDPLAEKYYSSSPYAMFGNNPVNNIDPDGRDYIININRNKDNEIIGVTIQAKVYITGAEASADRAKELNKLAKNTFSSKTIDGVKISFDVNYEYNENISASDLKKGENLLNFSEDEGRFEIEGKRKNIGGNIFLYSGKEGTIYSNGDNKTVMHETGHLMGLADRYDDYDTDHLPGGGRGSIPDPGFEKDLMGSSKNSNLIDFHYQQYLNVAKGYRPNVNRMLRYVYVG